MKLMEDSQRFWDSTEKNLVRRDYAHWLGFKRWKKRKAWEQIGKDNWDRFLQCLERTGMAHCRNAFRTMVNWGVGGGSDIPAFCNHFRVMYGIDCSRPTLEEAKKQAEWYGFGARFIPRPIEVWSIFDALPIEPVDFLLSTATYQHFPSKEYALEVTNLCRRVMRPGSIGVIQIRIDDGSKFYAQKFSAYGRGKNSIRFTSFTVPQFVEVLEKCRLEIVGDPDIVPGVQYGYFYVLRP